MNPHPRRKAINSHQRPTHPETVCSGQQSNEREDGETERLSPGHRREARVGTAVNFEEPRIDWRGHVSQ